MSTSTRNCLPLFLCLVLLALGSVAPAWELPYGNGAGQVGYVNNSNNGNVEQLYPEGPLAFRCVADGFCLLDSVGGRVFLLNKKGDIRKKISLVKEVPASLPDVDVLWNASGTKVIELAVLDSSTQKILRFRGDGTPLGAWGDRGEGPGRFLQVQFLAYSKAGHLAVGDVMARKITLFDRAGKVVREREWEWSGFCFDPQGNLCILRWDALEGRTHLMVESVTGKKVRDTALTIGQHTNPLLWHVDKGGTALVSFKPAAGNPGMRRVGRFGLKGKAVKTRLFQVPLVMNRYLDVDFKGTVHLGVGDFGKAPAGVFAVKPFVLP